MALIITFIISMLKTGFGLALPSDKREGGKGEIYGREERGGGGRGKEKRVGGIERGGKDRERGGRRKRKGKESRWDRGGMEGLR